MTGKFTFTTYLMDDNCNVIGKVPADSFSNAKELAIRWGKKEQRAVVVQEYNGRVYPVDHNCFYAGGPWGSGEYWMKSLQEWISNKSYGRAHGRNGNRYYAVKCKGRYI